MLAGRSLPARRPSSLLLDLSYRFVSAILLLSLPFGLKSKAAPRSFLQELAGVVWLLWCRILAVPHTCVNPTCIKIPCFAQEAYDENRPYELKISKQAACQFLNNLISPLNLKGQSLFQPGTADLLNTKPTVNQHGVCQAHAYGHWYYLVLQDGRTLYYNGRSRQMAFKRPFFSLTAAWMSLVHCPRL